MRLHRNLVLMEKYYLFITQVTQIPIGISTETKPGQNGFTTQPGKFPMKNTVCRTFSLQKQPNYRGKRFPRSPLIFPISHGHSQIQTSLMGVFPLKFQELSNAPTLHLFPHNYSSEFAVLTPIHKFYNLNLPSIKVSIIKYPLDMINTSASPNYYINTYNNNNLSSINADR